MAKNTSFERAKEMIFFQLENLMEDANFENAEEGKTFLQRAQTTSELISQYTQLETMKTGRITAVTQMMHASERTGITLEQIKEMPLLVENNG